MIGEPELAANVTAADTTISINNGHLLNMAAGKILDIDGEYVRVLSVHPGEPLIVQVRRAVYRTPRIPSHTRDRCRTSQEGPA